MDVTELFPRYTEKLVRTGLAAAETLLLGTGEAPSVGNSEGKDFSPPPTPGGRAGAAPPLSGDAPVWNRADPLTAPLGKTAARLGRRAVIAAPPAEPYRTMLRHLATGPAGIIRPQDFETRIFLTDLPVLPSLAEEELAAALQKRRAAVTRDGMIIATARRDLETAFVIYNAVCFAVFVKFFSDLLPPRPGDARSPAGTTGEPAGNATGSTTGRPFIPARPRETETLLAGILSRLNHPGRSAAAAAAAIPLHAGPFTAATAIREAIAATGRKTVAAGLVNANFGNISYRRDNELFITGRGSALDDLAADRILAVPLPGPSPRDAGASTELPAHRRIVLETPYRAVLHGHPPFTVILSMDCPEHDCPQRGGCHRTCPRPRQLAGVPVVSGEAGGGPYGLGNTVPPAVREAGAAIVYGHGVFTAGEEDFRGAFARLEELETACRELVLRMIPGLHSLGAGSL